MVYLRSAEVLSLYEYFFDVNTYIDEIANLNRRQKICEG